MTKRTRAIKPSPQPITPDFKRAEEAITHPYLVSFVPDDIALSKATEDFTATYDTSLEQCIDFMTKHASSGQIGVTRVPGTVVIPLSQEQLELLSKEPFINRMPVPGNNPDIHPVETVIFPEIDFIR